MDCGRDQVSPKVARDGRVLVLEGVNLRYLRPADLPSLVDIATLDLSFISVLKASAYKNAMLTCAG